MNKLSKILHEKYLTKAAFARELTRLTGKKVSMQRVNNWTQGKNKPDDNIRPVIADFLKTTIVELFYSDNEGK